MMVALVHRFLGRGGAIWNLNTRTWIEMIDWIITISLSLNFWLFIVVFISSFLLESGIIKLNEIRLIIIRNKNLWLPFEECILYFFLTINRSASMSDDNLLAALPDWKELIRWNIRGTGGKFNLIPTWKNYTRLSQLSFTTPYTSERGETLARLNDRSVKLREMRVPFEILPSVSRRGTLARLHGNEGPRRRIIFSVNGASHAAPPRPNEKYRRVDASSHYWRDNSRRTGKKRNSQVQNRLDFFPAFFRPTFRKGDCAKMFHENKVM